MTPEQLQKLAIDATYKDLSDSELELEILKLETISGHNQIAKIIVDLFRNELNERKNSRTC